MKFLKVVLKIYVGLGVAATVIFTLVMITFSGDSGHVSLSTVLIVGCISCALGGWIFVYIPLRVLRALEDFPSHLPLVAAYVIAVPLFLPLGIVFGSIEMVEAWRRRTWANGPLDAATRRRLRNRGLAVTGTIVLVVSALAHNFLAETLTTIVRGEPTWRHPFGTRLSIDYPGGVLRVPFRYLTTRYPNSRGTYELVFAWPNFSAGTYSLYDSGSWFRDERTVIIQLDTIRPGTQPVANDLQKQRDTNDAVEPVVSRFTGLREERFPPDSRRVAFLSALDQSVVGPGGLPFVFRCVDGLDRKVADGNWCSLDVPFSPQLSTHWSFSASHLADWERFTRETIELIESFQTSRAPDEPTR